MKQPYYFSFKFFKREVLNSFFFAHWTIHSNRITLDPLSLHNLLFLQKLFTSLELIKHIIMFILWYTISGRERNIMASHNTHLKQTEHIETVKPLLHQANSKPKANIRCMSRQINESQIWVYDLRLSYFNI